MYIDDILFVSDFEMECVENVKIIVKLLDNFGLIVNIEKYIFIFLKEI